MEVLIVLLVTIVVLTLVIALSYVAYKVMPDCVYKKIADKLFKD